MISIYKNKNNELECHIEYMGSDFKFQAIKEDFVTTTFEGSEKLQYLEFEADSLGYEILDNVQNIMFQILQVSDWIDGFEEDE